MLPSRGRPGTVLLMTRGRDLTQGDLLRLSSGINVPKVGAPMIQRLSATHHAAARHLAAGRSIRETGMFVGQTPQRIGDLTHDPQFQNLMAYYSDQTAEAGIDEMEKFRTKMKDIAELSTNEIIDRLEDPEKLKNVPTGELRQLAGDALNRIGLPTQTAISGVVVPTKITFNLGGRGLREVDPFPAPTPVIDHDPDSG